MLTFCIGCHALSVGKCEGKNHPSDCPKDKVKTAQRVHQQEMRECLGEV